MCLYWHQKWLAWSVLRIYPTTRDETDFASDCNIIRALELLKPALWFTKALNRPPAFIPLLTDFILFPRTITRMARWLERSDSAITEFSENIQLQKQWDVLLKAITLSKRNPHDDPQSPTWWKRIRHEEWPDSGGDADKVVYDMLPPQLSLKLKEPESLFVPQKICSSEQPPPLYSLSLRRASSWQFYIKAYRCELRTSVVVVCKNSATFELFAVKCIAESEVNDQAQTLCQVRHENSLTCYKIFVCDNAIFTVFKCMTISLADLNESAILLNKIQIATIIH